jgi:hypothetical protein
MKYNLFSGFMKLVRLSKNKKSKFTRFLEGTVARERPLLTPRNIESKEHVLLVYSCLQILISFPIMPFSHFCFALGLM